MFKIDNQFANANISRTIRFNEKIFDELSRASEKSGISFNTLVLQCCRYALDNLSNDIKDAK